MKKYELNRSGYRIELYRELGSKGEEVMVSMLIGVMDSIVEVREGEEWRGEVLESVEDLERWVEDSWLERMVSIMSMNDGEEMGWEGYGSCFSYVEELGCLVVMIERGGV